jgi:hypothetical protein
MKLQALETKLKKIERERDRLSRQLQTSRAKHFGAIPAKYGYRSVDALISALAPYASPAVRSRLGNSTTSAAAKAKKSAKSARPTRYSDQQRAAVRALLEKGGKTVPEISNETRVAITSIIDWKKKWGLVKKRKAARKK